MTYESVEIDGIEYFVNKGDEKVIVLRKQNGSLVVVSLGGDVASIISGLESALADESTARTDGDAARLLKSGGTMTGAILLSGNASSALHAVPLQQVQALIAAIVNGAPGTLDALNELAAAIGNDPNFAATIATSIGDKAAKAANLSDLANTATALSNLGGTANGKAIFTAADYAAMKILLGLVIGTNIQAQSSELNTLATLTSTANGRAILTAADYAAMKILLGLVPGTDVQAMAQSINPQTGTSYTLVSGDQGKLVTLNNAGAISLILPQDSDATYAVGVYTDFIVLGAGQVTAAAGTGATMHVSGLTAKSRATKSRLGVQKIAANTWSFFGDLAAS